MSGVSEIILAILLIIAAGLVSWGVGLMYFPAGVVTAGGLLAALAILFLFDVRRGS